MLDQISTAMTTCAEQYEQIDKANANNFPAP
jgi:hypothetical protein